MWKRLTCCLVAVGAFGLVDAADEAPKRPANEKRFIIDAREAGPDFAVQGEYAGTLSNGDGYGVQVIAQGGGHFRAVGYHGGLPGAGWDRSPTQAAEGETRDGLTRFEGEHGIAVFRDGDLTLTDPDGVEHAKLKRVERKSPTLGATPPTGAEILFDGKSTSAWKTTRMRDGLMQVGGQTKAAYQDFTLHIEFMTPYMPYSRGQDRGNSGLFLQRRYELQILDSFGLSGEDNECGGIYSFRRPDLNMCFPPLAWQTYDVDFTTARFDAAGKKTTNARVTIRHNGVPIHENLELLGPSPSGEHETPQGGPLSLQWHGNPVQFRNIWIVPAAAIKT